MARDMTNQLTHLFITDGYREDRRQPIIDKLNKFLQSNAYLNIVSISIRNQKDEDIISISTIPKLFKIVIDCISLTDFSKTLSEKDMKYFIYGVLYAFIVGEDPQFFDEGLSTTSFEKLFSGMYEIFLVLPDVLRVGKSLCVC